MADSPTPPTTPHPEDGSPADAPGGRNRGGLGRRLALIIGTLAVVMGLGAGAFYIWGLDYIAGRKPNKENKQRIVTIPKGASLETISRIMETEGLAPHRLIFTAYCVRRGYARKLRAGVYRLDSQMSVREAALALAEGKRLAQLTIPEGFTLAQVAQRMLETGFVESEEQILPLASDPDLLREAGSLGATLEGFLFPTSYDFEEGLGPKEMLGRMVHVFREAADEALTSPSLQLGRPLDRDQLVILASMIEREARNEGEMPLISSVYYNRLAKHMRLECDATVRYAIGKWNHALTMQDLKLESPYNTYMRQGLPPGAICNPGLVALRAAAAPAPSRFLFYVYRGNGGHEFSETYEKHLQAVKRYSKPAIHESPDGKPPGESSSRSNSDSP